MNGMKNVKFEYLFAFALLVVLTAALFIFRADGQMTNLIVGALVSGFGAITGFFFTRHNPNSGDK